MDYYSKMNDEQKKQYNDLKNVKNVNIELENLYQLQQEIFLQTRDLDSRLITLKKQEKNEIIEGEIKIIYKQLDENHQRYSEINKKIQKLENRM